MSLERSNPGRLWILSALLLLYSLVNGLALFFCVWSIGQASSQKESVDWMVKAGVNVLHLLIFEGLWRLQRWAYMLYFVLSAFAITAIVLSAGTEGNIDNKGIAVVGMYVLMCFVLLSTPTTKAISTRRTRRDLNDEREPVASKQAGPMNVDRWIDITCCCLGVMVAVLLPGIRNFFGLPKN